MTSQIKAVIFDHGGVLTRGGEKDANAKAAARAMNLRMIIVPDLIDDLKVGKINNSQFVQAINERYPNAPKELTNKMWDDVYNSLKPDKQAYKFAERCRQLELRVGLLTNINPAMAQKLRKDGSYKDFNPLVLSYKVRCAKPDEKIYAIVEKCLQGIKPNEILLFDDQDKCVVGAQKRGWKAIKVVSTAQMIRDADQLFNLR